MHRLIFIASQPRSGSTLLQRILAAHSQIHTVNEPWLLLPAFYWLRHDDVAAPFGYRSARIGLQGFLESIEGGAGTYLREAGEMHSRLYLASAERAGKHYFVDKTPRYYLILPEIRAAFPAARLILLFRNPLAVLASMIATWTRADADLLSYLVDDLLLAPRLMSEAAKADDSPIVVRFEDLVRTPSETISALCAKLRVQFEPSMIEYGRHEPPLGQLGDEKTIGRHHRPQAEHADGWIETMRNPQVWPWFGEYLNLLGRELVSDFGYDFDELAATVAANRPARIVDGRSPFQSGSGSSAWRRIVRAVRSHGFGGAVRAAYRLVADPRHRGTQR